MMYLKVSLSLTTAVTLYIIKHILFWGNTCEILKIKKCHTEGVNYYGSGLCSTYNMKTQIKGIA